MPEKRYFFSPFRTAFNRTIVELKSPGVIDMDNFTNF